MKYKGKELDEFKSDENVAFNPPRQMLVWDDGMDNPLVGYVGVFFPSWVKAVIINGGGVYKHCAEIPKSKTNWDLFQERYSAFRLSLETGIEVFNGHSIPCEFCPARAWCTSAEHSNSCKETFKSWAEMEADEEK